MKLGLLLASPPELPEPAEVYRAASDAMRRKDDVYLYLVDEGVRNLDRPEIEELRKGGIKLFACAYGAKRRKIAWDSDKATFSGLTVLVDMIAGCDEFLAFTPLGVSPRGTAQKKSSSLPRTLITITEDPGESHRPAEAVRIGAGIGGWKKTEVDFLLHGPASKILSPYADEWVDGENYEHYIPLVREWKRPVLLAPDAEDFTELAESETTHQRCTEAQVKQLTDAASFFIPF